MKNVLRILILLFIAPFFNSCIYNESDIKRSFTRVTSLNAVNINSAGATLRGSIEIGNQPVLSVGFVWSQLENPTLEKSDFVEIDFGKLENNSFEFSVSTTLMENVDYYFRAFVKEEDQIIYGTELSFKSLGSGAPQLIGFFPDTGMIGDTITIFGSNFSNLSTGNTIKFGSAIAEMVSVSDTLLTAIVPSQISKSEEILFVSINDQVSQSASKFKLLQPIIKQVVPTSVGFGDTIVVRGSNFYNKIHLNKITIESVNCQIIEATDSTLKVIMPLALATKINRLTAEINFQSTLFDGNLVIKDPSIASVVPNSGFSGDLVEISGEGFNRVYSEVYIGSLKAELISITSNAISIKVPYGITNNRINNIRVVSGEISGEIEGFEFLDTWLRKNDIPCSSYCGRYGSVGFSIGDFGYVGLGFGQNLEFWRYDPSENNWSRVADFPGLARYFASSFVIGTNAYVGGGTTSQGDVNDFWEFNSITNAWTKIQDFPYSIKRAVGLSSNDLGYLCTLNSTDNFYSFDPVSNEWVALPDIPQFTFSKPDSGFEIDGSLFIYCSGNSTGAHELLEYDISSGLWSLKQSLPSYNIDSGVTTGVSINGFGYIFNKNYYLHRFDPQLNEWTKLNSFYLERRDGTVFEISGKAYFAGGRNSSDRFDFWEYDPEYESEQ